MRTGSVLSFVISASLLLDPSWVSAVPVALRSAEPSRSSVEAMHVQALAAQPSLSHNVISETGQHLGFRLRARIRTLFEKTFEDRGWMPAGASDLMRQGLSSLLDHNIHERHYRLYWAWLFEGSVSFSAGALSYVLTGDLSDAAGRAAVVFIAMHVLDVLFGQSLKRVAANTAVAGIILALASSPILVYGRTSEALVPSLVIFIVGHFVVNKLLERLRVSFSRPWRRAVEDFDNEQSPLPPFSLHDAAQWKLHVDSSDRRENALRDHVRKWLQLIAQRKGLNSLYELMVLLKRHGRSVNRTEEVFVQNLSAEAQRYLVPEVDLEKDPVTVPLVLNNKARVIVSESHDKLQLESRLNSFSQDARDVFPAVVISGGVSWVLDSIRTDPAHILGLVATYETKDNFLERIAKDVLLESGKPGGSLSAAVDYQVNKMHLIYDYHGLSNIHKFLISSPRPDAPVLPLLKTAIHLKLQEHERALLSPWNKIQKFLGLDTTISLRVVPYVLIALSALHSLHDTARPMPFTEASRLTHAAA